MWKQKWWVLAWFLHGTRGVDEISHLKIIIKLLQTLVCLVCSASSPPHHVPCIFSFLLLASFLGLPTCVHQGSTDPLSCGSLRIKPFTHPPKSTMLPLSSRLEKWKTPPVPLATPTSSGKVASVEFIGAPCDPERSLFLSLHFLVSKFSNLCRLFSRPCILLKF